MSFALADETAWVRVVPEETDEILANPGMGCETFHRTASNDKSLPAWILLGLRERLRRHGDGQQVAPWVHRAIHVG